MLTFEPQKKHYINDGEVAKWMVKNGFRIFDKKNEKDTPVRHARKQKRLYISVKS
jgi:hypothetical protein